MKLAVGDDNDGRSIGHQQVVNFSLLGKKAVAVVVDDGLADHGDGITRATNLSTLSVSLATVYIRLIMRASMLPSMPEG